jgi:signal transduction histidine kinase
LAGKAQATNSEVISDLSDDLPPALIDPDMFEKSLLEILKNALAALGSQPGRIRVSCYLDQLQEKLLLEVADSGIGMEATVARNVFVPFFSSLPAGRGRGLGLSLAKTFIEANQGRLWLRSHPGEGTTVWMALPLAKEG